MTAAQTEVKSSSGRATRRARDGLVAIANGRSASFATRFIGKGGLVDIDHVAEVFHMTRGQLAQTAGLGATTLTKIDRRKSPKTQRRVTEMLEIISRVRDWAGGEAQAMAWYRSQPIPALDGRTSEALVKSGRADSVRDYLDHMALGGFA